MEGSGTAEIRLDGHCRNWETVISVGYNMLLLEKVHSHCFGSWGLNFLSCEQWDLL